MRYEVTHGSVAYSVDVTEAGPDLFDVSVDDGPTVRIDACKSPRTTYSVLIDHRQYEASVDDREDGMLDVHVGASAFNFEVIDERRKKLALAGAVAPLTGTQEVRAHMPGKIVKLMVEEGREVSEDQGLVVIEAMKMENELRSPIDGVVTRIAVAEGDAVETDALLLVIEPPDAEE